MLNPDKCNICQTTFMSSFIIHRLGGNYAVCGGKTLVKRRRGWGLKSQTASLRYAIMSLRSFSFLKPAKAIVVPGMYLSVGTKRKHIISKICTHNACNCKVYLFGVREVLKKRVLAPDNSLFLVRLSVFETFCLTRMPTEQTFATS